ncbi:J domain-containing protein, partial [Mesorhizobium sp. M7A.F.Ca.US.003.02.2.1]
MRDPYEVLGVARNASAKDIKSAYRKLAKKHHPDQNPNDPKAKDRFAAANQAYEIVGDEKNRAAFDRGEIDADGKPRFQGFEGAAGGGDPFGGFRRQQGPGGSRFEFRSGRPGGDPFDGNSDIFSQIFGDTFSGARGPGMGDRRQQTTAADLNVTLDVTIEEAA